MLEPAALEQERESAVAADGEAAAVVDISTAEPESAPADGHEPVRAKPETIGFGVAASAILGGTAVEPDEAPALEPERVESEPIDVAPIQPDPAEPVPTEPKPASLSEQQAPPDDQSDTPPAVEPEPFPPSPIAPIVPMAAPPSLEVWNTPGGRGPFEQPYQAPKAPLPPPEVVAPPAQATAQAEPPAGSTAPAPAPVQRGPAGAANTGSARPAGAANTSHDCAAGRLRATSARPRSSRPRAPTAGAQGWTRYAHLRQLRPVVVRSRPLLPPVWCAAGLDRTSFR